MKATRRHLTTLLVTALGLAPRVSMAQPPEAVEPDSAELPTDDEPTVVAAIELYQSARYDECIKAFAGLLDEKEIVEDEQQRARYYYIACLIAAGKADDADQQIRESVRTNPQLFPDRREFPPPVIDRFIMIRNQMIQEIEDEQKRRIERSRKAAEAARAKRAAERARIIKLRELASRETVIQKNSRWIAVVPFGVGQFQNRNEALGYTFLSVETLLLAGWLTAVTAEMTVTAQADENKDAKILSDRLDSWRTVNTITGWSFVGVAALGVLQAQLAFEPEFRSERPRKLPDELRRDPPPEPPAVSVTPVVAPTDRGAAFGMIGRF